MDVLTLLHSCDVGNRMISLSMLALLCVKSGFACSTSWIPMILPYLHMPNHMKDTYL